MKCFDAVIIGGGVIGCSLARLLAGAGLNVAVVERGAPGEESSWAAAGMLSPSAEAEEGSPLFELGRASRELFANLTAELESETGIDSRYRTEGTLLLFGDEAERSRMMPSIEWQQRSGVAVEGLTSSEIRRKEPHIADVDGGFYFPSDHQIDNRLLMQALVRSCQARGVEFLLGRTVHEVEHDAGKVERVRLDDRCLGTRQAVNAAGCWAGAIQVNDLAPAPIHPVKGQMIALQSERVFLSHVIRTHWVYLVPRQNGRILVGSTMENAGFDKTPRVAALTSLLQAAQRLCPELRESAVSEFWAGLRPASPDGLPLLGPTTIEGYFLATGHFRNGILLAPITSQILSHWMLHGNPPFPVDFLLPNRF